MQIALFLLASLFLKENIGPPDDSDQPIQRKQQEEETNDSMDNVNSLEQALEQAIKG